MTGDKTYVTFSFLLKNLVLLALVIKYVYLPLRQPLENKIETLDQKNETKEEESPNQDKLEQIFEKLRKKERLATKADQTLNTENDRIT